MLGKQTLYSRVPGFSFKTIFLIFAEANDPCKMIVPITLLLEISEEIQFAGIQTDSKVEPKCRKELFYSIHVEMQVVEYTCYSAVSFI